MPASLDDGFGHWLAGFIDGEGSFTINQRRRGYSCRFSLHLRQDDRPILCEIQNRLGIGHLADRKTLRDDGKFSHLSSMWCATSKADCASLVALLDCHPLRAKKARDYAIWREAVLEWRRVTRFTGTLFDWSRMAELKVALESGRRFEAPTPVMPPRSLSEQLVLP